MQKNRENVEPLGNIMLFLQSQPILWGILLFWKQLKDNRQKLISFATEKYARIFF